MTDPTALRALAEAAKAADLAQLAYLRKTPDALFNTDEYVPLCEAADAATLALQKACTWLDVLSLLADRERGAADTRRLTWMAENPGRVTWAIGYGSRGTWTYRDASHTVHVAESLADAIDKAANFSEALP